MKSSRRRQHQPFPLNEVGRGGPVFDEEGRRRSRSRKGVYKGLKARYWLAPELRDVDSRRYGGWNAQEKSRAV